MMIKITAKCSMGCSHCMNSATCNGEHMDFGTFRNAVAFQKTYCAPVAFITGGEPFEHPQFLMFLMYALQELPDHIFTIATNGIFMQSPDMSELVHNLGKRFPPVEFQVCNDSRYYPTSIDLSLPVFHEPNVVVIKKIPKLYPQGRTLDNKLEWDAEGSKCFNVRAVAHQLENPTLKDIMYTLALGNRICTPHITIDGHIKLGESDLCPNCSSIYKSDKEIVNDILNFRCQKCSHVNCRLSPFYRHLIGE